MNKKNILMRLIGLSLALLLLFSASAFAKAQAEDTEQAKENTDEVIENATPSNESEKAFLGFDPALFEKEPKEIIEILKKSDCIVHENLSTTSGSDRSDEFVTTTMNKNKSTVKSVSYYNESNALYFSKIDYDGEKYVVSMFSLEDPSDITVRSYRYLISGEYAGDVFYLLVNSEEISISDVFSALSEKPGPDVHFLKVEKH